MASPRRLTTGRAPLISPDGRWVAFQRCRPQPWICRELRVISSAGGKSRILARGVVRQAMWFPDSLRILADIHGTLVIIHVASGKQIVLDRGHFFGFSISPSGKAVVYSRGFSNDVTHAKPNLFLAWMPRGAPTRITEDGRSLSPVWGPQSVASSKIPSTRDPNERELWLIDPTSLGQRRLVSPPRGSGLGVVPIDWSEDGRSLLAAYQSQFDRRPLAVSVSSEKTRPIGRFPPDWIVFASRLSGDGRLVLAETGPFDHERLRRVEQLLYRGDGRKVIARNAAQPDWNL